jgi:hypothetical protein
MACAANRGVTGDHQELLYTQSTTAAPTEAASGLTALQQTSPKGVLLGGHLEQRGTKYIAFCNRHCC